MTTVVGLPRDKRAEDPPEGSQLLKTCLNLSGTMNWRGLRRGTTSGIVFIDCLLLAFLIWIHFSPFSFRWADQCPGNHDSNHVIAGFSYVGQNMADSWNFRYLSNRGYAQKIKDWYDEVSID